MPSNDPLTWFVGLVVLFAGIAAFQWMLFPTLTDDFRQRMFRLRRDMFLLIVDNSLAPAEPAYTQLRSTINGILLYAERLTLGRLLLHGAIFREQTQAYAKKLREDLAQVQDPVIREQLAEFRLRIGQEIIRHVITISPIAWLVVLLISPVLLGMLCSRGINAFFQGTRKGVRWLAERLYVQGFEAQAEALVVQSGT